MPCAPAQRSVDIRQFGPVGNGANDGTTLKRALSSVHGVLLIPAGLILNASGSFDVPSGTSLEGGGTLTGVKLDIGSNTTVSGLTFEGATAGIYISPSTVQSNDVIQGNTFRGVSLAIHITASKDGGTAHDLNISRNTCVACDQFLYADKADHSVFSGNVVQVRNRGLLLYGGSANRIVDNQVDGGITGISFVYQFTIAGENGLVLNNIIQRNHIKNVREESISFDVRGNEPDHMAVREVDKIASKTASSVTLSSSGWESVGAAMHKLYLCWMSGTLEGICLRSAGGTGGTFQLGANAQQMQQMTPGDLVVVGAPFLSNAVYQNTIQIDPSNQHASGIMLWGLSYDNVVCGNAITSPTQDLKISGIGIVSLNGLNQHGGVTATPGGRKAPSEHNLVANNQISNLRLEAVYQDWGNQTHYLSKGNLLVGNTVAGGIVDVKDQDGGESAGRTTGPAMANLQMPHALLTTLQSTGGNDICGIPGK